MKRREGLHKDLPFDISPARPPRHLREQLKSPFAGPEIRLMQRHVRIDNPHQGHIRKMQSFGDHLRPDQDIDLPVSKGLQHPAIILFPLHHIRIHPLHPRMRKQFTQYVFHFLGAQPGIFDARIFAFFIRANPGYLFIPPTKMAAQ